MAYFVFVVFAECKSLQEGKKHPEESAAVQVTYKTQYNINITYSIIWRFDFFGNGFFFLFVKGHIATYFTCMFFALRTNKT